LLVFRPLKKFEKLRMLKFQKITQFLPLVDLRIVKRWRSDLREKILKMWMLIRESSLP
jgi:hypothetical protein